MDGRSRILVALAVLCGLTAFAFTAGAPRLTLTNTGVRVGYPASQTGMLAGAAAAIVLMAFLPRGRGVRLAIAGVAAATLLAAADRIAYSVEADATGLRSRRGPFQTVIPWTEVRRVEQQPAALTVWGVADSIGIDTSEYRPEQRAALERLLSRRTTSAR